MTRGIQSSRRFLLLFAVASAFLMPLAGCGSSDSKDSDKEVQTKEEKKEQARLEKKKGPPICPQVAIVREIDDFRDYGQSKPDPAELVAEARLETIQGDCSYRKEGIDIAFDLSVVAAKGPRLGGTSISFPYFIAMVDPDQNVIAKDKMNFDFRFGDDKSKRVVSKTVSLHVFVPLDQAKWDTGPYYQVLAGFQLTQDQLDEVRAREAQIPHEAMPSGDGKSTDDAKPADVKTPD